MSTDALHLPHPLDWWALSPYEHAYAAVCSQTGWSRAKARREVHQAIRKRGWRPKGHRGYRRLHDHINTGGLLEHELI